SASGLELSAARDLAWAPPRPRGDDVTEAGGSTGSTISTLEFDRVALEEHKAVMTLEEFIGALKDAPPASSDDVAVTLDGRRLDTREKVLAWVEELNASRAAEGGAD